MCFVFQFKGPLNILSLTGSGEEAWSFRHELICGVPACIRTADRPHGWWGQNHVHITILQYSLLPWDVVGPFLVSDTPGCIFAIIPIAAGLWCMSAASSAAICLTAPAD